MAKLTGAATRAARALLKWSMRDLAEHSRVSLPTILKLESDKAVSDDTAEKIVSAFAAHGVEITNGDGTGARLRFVDDDEMMVDARGLPALRAYWRVTRGSAGGYSVAREPFRTTAENLYFATPREAEAYLERQGFTRDRRGRWFEPLS